MFLCTVCWSHPCRLDYESLKILLICSNDLVYISWNINGCTFKKPVWNVLVIYVPLQISKEEIHLPYHFQSISDTPLRSSINYPPRLLLTVDSCDSGRPLRDLECKLDVKGTVERCEFMLKMKAPSVSEGII